MNQPKRYTKKPVTIEAVQFDGEPGTATAIIEWISAGRGTATLTCDYLDDDQKCPGAERHHISVRTLEGDMKASPGWWIIRGLVGEFYPCDPDVFARSYDEAEEGQ